jgi:hypothetical protein
MRVPYAVLVLLAAAVVVAGVLVFSGSDDEPASPGSSLPDLAASVEGNRWTVRNAGRAPSGAFEIIVGGSPPRTVTLDPGQETSGEITEPCIAESVGADPIGKVEESDETNNSAQFACEPQPR